MGRYRFTLAREAFDEAALFARAEALHNGQFAARWNSLPPGEITVTEPIVASLEQSIHDYYWRKELRGRLCRVHHYRRAGGAADVLNAEESDSVHRMAEALRGHGLACDLLSEGVPEGMVRAEYCQMPCQIRMDLTVTFSRAAKRSGAASGGSAG